MDNTNFDSKHWKELGFGDKMKFTIAGALVTSSIVIGFISFIWLTVIPTSVIALSGLWLSTALAILGISSYFHNEMVHFQSEVETKLRNIEHEHNDELSHS